MTPVDDAVRGDGHCRMRYLPWGCIRYLSIYYRGGHGSSSGHRTSPEMRLFMLSINRFEALQPLVEGAIHRIKLLRRPIIGGARHHAQ